MHLFRIAACACLALIAASCSVVQPKPLPGTATAPGAAPQAGVVHINLVPEAGGIRARYALPGSAKVFAFRDNASDIRTDTWSTPTAGAKLERNHIALGDGLRVFEIDLTPDTQQRDRIYPSLSRIGDGWLIYAPQLLPPEGSGQPHDVSYSLPDGWVVLGPTDDDGDIALDGWVFVGPPALIESGAANVAIAPATPAWLRAEVLGAANSAAEFFEKRLGIKLEARPGIVISVYPEDSSNSVRGDVTPGAMMSVRFYGDVWMRHDPGSADQVRDLLAHEIFHFWNGGAAASADDAEKPWLHEGGASYAAMLALSPGAKPGDAAFMRKLNDNLAKCQTALEDNESLRTARNLQFGNAPYACGVVLQWAWDAGLRFTSGNARDVLSLWKDMIADARGQGGKYSLDSAVRLAPGPASRAANLLLGQSGETRWDYFAAAMRGYGAQLTRQRNGDEDRAAALMHVIGLHCNGQYGFFNFDSFLRFDTGNRCGPLNGDKEFDAVAGVGVAGDGSALHDKVRAACAAGDPVDFSRKGVVVASATCTQPLAPAKERLMVTRAFGAWCRPRTCRQRPVSILAASACRGCGAARWSPHKTEDIPMIGYAMLGTNNYAKALEFYDTVLAPVGGKRMMDFGVSTVFGTDKGGAMLGVGQPYNKEPATWGNGTMIALQMPSKEKVHEVYDAAIKAGATCEGPAGARGDTFYAGYFRDLDGNKLCAFHAPGM